MSAYSDEIFWSPLSYGFCYFNFHYLFFAGRGHCHLKHITEDVEVTSVRAKR